MNPHTKMKLLGDHILAEALEPEALTPSGLVLPPTADNQKTGIRVRILLIGAKFRHTSDVSVGDVVLVSKYLGNALSKLQDGIRLYDGEDVLGIVT